MTPVFPARFINKYMKKAAKKVTLLKDDLQLPVNTMEVLKQRYLLKDDNQNIIETPDQMFRRVARYIAQAEDKFRFRCHASAG